MKKKQSINNVKMGAIFSYAFIILNSVYGLAITPYILRELGTVEFGVYKTIVSLSTSLMVLDLGIGGTTTRYIAKFLAEKKNEKEPFFISMILGEAMILVLIIIVICLCIYMGIPFIYKSGLNSSQITLARVLFLIQSITICIHVIENVLNGIISGHNLFALGNGLKLLRILLRIGLTFPILLIYRSSVALVIIDLMLTIGLLICEMYFVSVILQLPIRLSFHNWDMHLFRESFKYTGLLFLTSIAAQVNSNLDNVVIGAELGASYVAVYSMALIIFVMFVNLSTAISDVMLPTITNSLSEDSSGKVAMKIVMKAGRIQFILLGATFGGFLVLGKDFISLWLGEGFQDIYIVVLILMGPSLLELCVNICLSILRAKNMLAFRTAILTAMTILNALITIIGVKIYGYYAAAIGTGISFLFGSVIIMNIYYYIVLHYNMLKVYRQIFHKSWICIFISSILTWIASRFIHGSWRSFLVDVAIFIIVYVSLLMKFGFEQYEKDQIKAVINKIQPHNFIKKKI